MCYEIRALTLAKKKYAERYGGDYLDIKEFDRIMELFQPLYYASGFDHPDLPVITGEKPAQIQLLNWGLIPFWTKSAAEVVKIQNQTLNARAETIFEKPTFKEAVVNRRCIVVTDGFYEHHHKNGKTFPYHIHLKDDQPMSLAGVWERWKADGIERTTVSIITTKANKLMTKIHNNPKLSEGPRMPVILSRENEKEWLFTDEPTPEKLESLLVPFDESVMEAYTVPRLKGKSAVGNKEEALKNKEYPELTTIQTGLF